MTGKFEHLIDIQELEYQDSGFDDGEPEHWVLLRKEFFKLRPTDGKEYVQGDQVKTRATHDGRCHWFSGASTKLRLEFGTRYFHVESVTNENERNYYLNWKLIEVFDGS